MRKVLARLVVALAIAAPIVGAASGSSADGPESGWWWKGNAGASVTPPAPAPQVNFPTTPPPAPPPPNAAGGLMVAATPDGAAAIAAVRASGAASALTLTVADKGANDAGAHLLACETQSPWSAQEAGRWDDKPSPACDLTNGGGSVAGVRSEDGATWSFGLAALGITGTTDLVIVPAAPGGQLQPFQLVFKKPDMAAFTFNDASTEAQPGEESFSIEPDAFPVDTAADLPTGDLFVDAGTGAIGTSGPIATAALDPQEQAAPLPVVQQGGPVAPASSASDSAQFFGILIILAAAGAAYLVAQRPLPAARSLAGVGFRTRTVVTVPATPREGGLGQFARLRTGAPPRLY